MGGTKKRQNQRHRMAHRQKWRCFFCGIKMLPAGTKIAGTKKVDERSVTYEHWDSKLDPERGTHGGEFRNVASCWKCNSDRNRERERSLPKDELWKRSGAYPLEVRNELDNSRQSTCDDPQKLCMADAMGVRQALSHRNDLETE